MKLCKDCKHFVPVDELCLKGTPAPDYLYGAPRVPRRAQDMRIWTMKDDCSPEAKFFEPKEAA